MDSEYMGIPEAAKIEGVGRRTIYNRVKNDPDFPPIVRFSSRCARIRRADHAAYLAKKHADAARLRTGALKGGE